MEDILYNWFCLAELERQQERPVSLERRQRAEPEPQPQLLRQQVERELPLRGCQKVALFPTIRWSFLLLVFASRQVFSLFHLEILKAKYIF